MTDLSERLSRGEAAAFEELYDRYADRLYGYLLVIVRRPEVAEDLLQTVMLRLTRSRRRLRRVERLPAYVFSIARNEARRWMAKAARRGASDGTGDVEFLVAPEDDPELLDLRRAIARLPRDRLEVVSLKVYQRLTFEEIGEVLGISPNTAASRYRYAIRDLREILDVSGDGGSDERR